ncbi:hypothetical protein BU16DRAFT_536296 [Lophium mytilinum]|uniref:Uncharacterized protein n=1 Tax=Lophium mytilinum TaxID=390894 RepID=A0A6A6R488_9PEZI|nr:hypothetical protein BU16DRAFT_536296 [Lophium mytilinum]
MDSTPTVSAPALSGTKCASSCSLRIFENPPSSAADVVVVFSQLVELRKLQEDCCERLKAAKLPARILTFAYDAQPPSSMNNGTQGLTSAEAAVVFCQSLSSEREASGRKNDPILFLTTKNSVDSIIPIILGDSLVLGPLAEETDVNSIIYAPIKRSTFGVLRLHASPYTYRQRILETAILTSLQAVIIIALHIYKLYCGSLFDPSWPIWSSLSVIGFVQKALVYTLLGWFALGYVHLATMQFDVNRNDRLQWVFIAVGISVVIPKHWHFATIDLQALALPLAVTITASMVFSAWMHWVWRFISNDKESKMEKKVKMLVRRASNMVPGDPSRFIEYDSVLDNMSNFTFEYWPWDCSERLPHLYLETCGCRAGSNTIENEEVAFTMLLLTHRVWCILFRHGDDSQVDNDFQQLCISRLKRPYRTSVTPARQIKHCFYYQYYSATSRVSPQVCYLLSIGGGASQSKADWDN